MPVTLAVALVVLALLAHGESSTLPAGSWAAVVRRTLLFLPGGVDAEVRSVVRRTSHAGMAALAMTSP